MRRRPDAGACRGRGAEAAAAATAATAAAGPSSGAPCSGAKAAAPPAPPRKGFLDYALPIASLGLQAASMGCDERIKVDMAPLESSDINDDLAEIAFFVKGLRECA